jgi:glycosyltransferase involved in cell wall biosynthesis
MFSIIIPLYNKSKFILRTIESVFQQSFQEWEIIIIDDGSTDDGFQKVLNLNSERITLLQKKNTGVSESRNLGISKAKFPFIAFLDADDYWHKDYLYLMKTGIETFPESSIWASSFSKDLSDLNVPNNSFELVKDYFQKELEKTSFFTSSVVMKKIFFDKNLGFKPYLKRGEDLDVWYRAICLSGNVAYCNNPAVLYERGDTKGATKTTTPIRASILYEILNEDYLLSQVAEPSQLRKFEDFKDKFVYLNLYKYLTNPDNQLEINKILSKIRKRNKLVHFAYHLPFSFLRLILKNKRGNRFFKNFISSNIKILTPQ